MLQLQAVLLIAYGVPYALAPASMTTMTGQLPVPETAVLRVLGCAFIALALVELRAVANGIHRPLANGFAFLPSAVFIIIVAQAVSRGFNGAAWYWWLNAVVTLVVGGGILMTARAGDSVRAARA
jgi:hypothetical protein